MIISPNNEFIVSVGSDGAVFLWETPLEIRLNSMEGEIWITFLKEIFFLIKISNRQLPFDLIYKNKKIKKIY